MYLYSRFTYARRLEADADATSTTFRLQFPVPLAIYNGFGQAHASAKAAAVKAIFEICDLSVLLLAGDRSMRALNASAMLVDVTPYLYHHRDVSTIGEWVDVIFTAIMQHTGVRGLVRLYVLVMDAGHVPQKSFEDALRRDATKPRSEPPPTAATPMPSKEEWASFVGYKEVQTAIWQIMVSRMEDWHKDNAPASTIILDGPDVNGDPAPPAAIVPKNARTQDATIKQMAFTLAAV